MKGYWISLTLVVAFCFFGLYMSIKQQSGWHERCQQIEGTILEAKGVREYCILKNGRLVDVSNDDYREVAARLLKED